MISHSRRPNRFQSRPWLVQMNGSLRLTITLSGRQCGNLKHLPQPVSGLVAGMATVPPAILRRRCSPMTPRAPSTRICTRIVSSSTQPLIRWSNAGRRCKITRLLRARKFAENVYYHELARQLRGFGYQIRNQARGDFQIEGVSEEICDRFSKRDAEVDKALAKLLADKPELAGANIKEIRGQTGTLKLVRGNKRI